MSSGCDSARQLLSIGNYLMRLSATAAETPRPSATAAESPRSRSPPQLATLTALLLTWSLEPAHRAVDNLQRSKR